ncbi:MAG: hypothetical protein AABX68_00925 [Nanoarchaeota archaeon]
MKTETKQKIKKIIAKIGKGIWIALGLFFLLIIFSWSSYVRNSNDFSGVIILVLLMIILVPFAVYLLITLIFFIVKKIRQRKRK